MRLLPLRMLSEMFGLGLSDELLCSLAARLGSDCPFFIYNRPMLATGRGEVLVPYEIDVTKYRIEVTNPGIHVSTREAYAGITPRDRRTNSPLIPVREALARPLDEWRDCLVNDFEEPVFAAHPELAAIKADFYAFDEDHYLIRGKRTGHVFHLGDPVRIRVKGANLEQRIIDYELIEEKTTRKK